MTVPAKIAFPRKDTKPPLSFAVKFAKSQGLPVPEEIETADQPKKVYTSLRTLYPGQDYDKDTLFYTVPAFIHTTKTSGKGDSKKTIPVIETHTTCVTSQGEIFDYDEQTLYDRGYAFPKTFGKPREDSWGGEIVLEYAAGKTTPPNPRDLYMQVRKMYESYMEFSDENYYDIMTLWVLGTYMFKVFMSYPYLHFNGTRDSGKSQNLRLLKTLGFNTHWSGEMTAPDMYRHVAGNPGVICIDEAEKWRGERAEALMSILRSGYSKGMEVSRQRSMPDGRYEQERFPTYCPKAIASINPLDDTTRSRAIVVRMRPALRIIPLFKPDNDRWETLRNDLHLWGLNNASAVAKRYEQWHDIHEERLPELSNRSWEISAALISLMDYIFDADEATRIGEWLIKYFDEQRRLTDSSDLTRLLALSLPSYIRDTPAHSQWYYPLKSVLDHLLDYLDDSDGTKLTARSLPRHLTPLGFGNIKASKRGRLVQILEGDLRRVFRERRIEPLSEDVDWLEERVNHQSQDKLLTEEQTFGFDTEG